MEPVVRLVEFDGDRAHLVQSAMGPPVASAAFLRARVPLDEVDRRDPPEHAPALAHVGARLRHVERACRDMHLIVRNQVGKMLDAETLATSDVDNFAGHRLAGLLSNARKLA